MLQDRTIVTIEYLYELVSCLSYPTTWCPCWFIHLYSHKSLTSCVTIASKVIPATGNHL